MASAVLYALCSLYSILKIAFVSTGPFCTRPGEIVLYNDGVLFTYYCCCFCGRSMVSREMASILVSSRISSGSWSRHFPNRMRTLGLVSHLPPFNVYWYTSGWAKNKEMVARQRSYQRGSNVLVSLICERLSVVVSALLVAIGLQANRMFWNAFITKQKSCSTHRIMEIFSCQPTFQTCRSTQSFAPRF